MEMLPMTSTTSYIDKGFAALQIAVDMAFIEISSGQTDKISFSIQEFPYPPHTLDDGITKLFIHFLPLITIFSFIFLCPAVLQRVGEEKYSGITELMKLVGLKSWMLWTGWLVHALSTNVLSVIAIVILMKVPLWGVSYPLIEHSDGTILFLFLMLYCVASITFCFFIATLINKPSIANVVGILIWIFSFFIPRTLTDQCEIESWNYKMVFAVFPNMALHYGYLAISVYERRGVGVHWSNLHQPGSGDEEDVTMCNVIFALVFDIVLLFLATLYTENVKPGEFGISKPWKFPFTNFKKWLKRSCVRRSADVVEEVLMEEGGKEKSCILISHLHKRFYNIVAVEDVTMSIQKNRITVLLGHNGAGKSTIMATLTGMIDATTGCVTINDKDIKKDADTVRADLGLCLQHNLCFPELTVAEQLEFFAMLRGVPSTTLQKSIDDVLDTVCLQEKKHSFPDTLSGGEKRKLCLGMALIGEPKILILDEPTSGMDPQSRRNIWNSLLQYRKTKTILISTHFMEEADVLGDYIAIMANGKLQCFGTPMHLKNQYNTGYHLQLLLVKNDTVDTITTEIRNQISGTHFLGKTHLLGEVGGIFTYVLPLNKKPRFSNLFQTLEKKKVEWGISSMSIKLTTLNDVFLKAHDEVDGMEQSTVKFEDSKNDNLHPTVMGNLSSLWLKRWYFFRRKYWWYFPATFVAYSIFLLTMWLGSTTTRYYNYGGRPLNLSLNLYPRSKVYYDNSSEDPFITQLRTAYHQIVLDLNGIPTATHNVLQDILQTGSDNIIYYSRHLVAAVQLNSADNGNNFNVNALYSIDAVHSIPASINLAMNAIIKTLCNDSYSITTYNAPFKPPFTDTHPSELSSVTVGVLWIVLIPTALAFFMSNFIIFPSVEVSTKFVQFQRTMGIKVPIYWLINIIFDFVLCLMEIILLLVIIFIANSFIFSPENFGLPEYSALLFILLMHTPTALPFCYMMSYRETISGGFSLLLILTMVGGILPAMVIYALENSGVDNYSHVGKWLQHVFFLLSPQFGISYIILKFSKKYVENFNWNHMDQHKMEHLCKEYPTPCCFGNTLECDEHKSYWLNEHYGIVSNVLELTLSFVFYFVLLWFLNTEKFQRLLHLAQYRDIASINSKNRTSRLMEDSEVLVASNLSKSFGSNKPVKNLELELKRNQCFGLLGVNGAGKSTTFRMLTKNMFFDQGDVNIRDSGKQIIPISESEYSQRIGYCPQEDCLNYYLTGQELTTFVATIRGYSYPDAIQISNELMGYFGLEKYANKPCLEYSGGNKRKLCACLAFLGFPSIILLDEPTSGVDPTSRRKFWDVLESLKRDKKTSFLLCSHSMEECENLCDEIGIMKGGQITAKGTIHNLREKYQKGYKIEVTLKTEDPNKSSELKNNIRQQLCISKNREYSTFLEYEVDGTTSLAVLFNIMEDLKTNFQDILDDYVIAPMSLEDIFLEVANTTQAT